MVLAAADPRSFPALVRILKGGGVVIAPGDTMYGLIGIAPETEDRLRRVKGRGEDKPFLQLIADRGLDWHASPTWRCPRGLPGTGRDRSPWCFPRVTAELRRCASRTTVSFSSSCAPSTGPCIPPA